MSNSTAVKEPEQIELRQPLLIRLFHWTFAVVMLNLITAGFYLHQPHYWYPFRDMKQVLLILDFTAFLIIALFVTRTYYGLLNREYQNIILNQKDLQRGGEFLRYLLFLKPNFQQHEQYNPFQRLLFCSWIVAFLFLTLTGLILYEPQRLQFLQLPFGSLSNVRLIHYLFSVWFALTIPGHIYFALTSDPAKLQAMLTGYLRKNS